MARKAEIIRALTLPPADLVRSLFGRREVDTPTDPRHSDVPLLRCAEIAAVYHSQRVAGDFYEFLRSAHPVCCSACSIWPAAERTRGRS